MPYSRILLLIGLLTSLPAHAAAISYQFTGHVVSMLERTTEGTNGWVNASSLAGPMLTVNDSVDGVFSFNTANPRSMQSSPDIGVYYGTSAEHIVLHVARSGFIFDSNAEGGAIAPELWIVDGRPGDPGTTDGFSLTTYGQWSGNRFALASVDLRDVSNDILTNSMLETLPSLAGFANKSAAFQFGDGTGNQLAVHFVIDEMQAVTEVPEPASVFLLAPALLLLRSRRR